jgi:hypothetical protein
LDRSENQTIFAQLKVFLSGIAGLRNEKKQKVGEKGRFFSQLKKFK